MKIEKLTENKIRIIIKSSDLNIKNSDFNSIINVVLKDKNFFLDILERAKTEFGFDTDGYKLLIEAFNSFENVFIFTITKYSANPKLKKYDNKKRLLVKRKNYNKINNSFIYKFNNFDELCDFCIYINTNIKNLFTNSTLYFYNNTYYLVFKNFCDSCEIIKKFNCLASEFITKEYFSDKFENKLLEHGKIIWKN